MDISYCTICPNKCGVNRNTSVGACGVGSQAKIARIGLHYFEEPFISGDSGSGTIFFSGCNLKCVFCQNYEISSLNKGKYYTIDQIIQGIKELEEMGANNINLVTPTHYAHIIAETLRRYKPSVPVIYNSSGYESVDTLKELEGLVDVFLPDFKYFDDDIAKRYSRVNNYREIASQALKEMVRQQPEIVIENGLIKRGVVVRHLVLPDNTDDSMQVINYLYNEYGDRIWLSVMNQYTPQSNYCEPPLNRCLKKIEYTRIVALLKRLKVTNCFIQEGDASGNIYVPKFEGE